jgi:membrane protease subunit HflC
MKKLATVLIVLGVLLVIFLILGPFYTVDEGYQAVVTRFGKIVTTTTEAGLKIKMPMVDTVVKYPKKILSWDGEPQRVPTKENQFIWVDATARWKIEDPAKFYESVTTIEQGLSRLDDVIDSAIRTVIADNNLREAVRSSNVINEIVRIDTTLEQVGELASKDSLSKLNFAVVKYESLQKGRKTLSDEMFNAAQKMMPEFGVELIDVIIRQIRYSDDLTDSVYQRMIKERNQIAEGYRSLGEAEKANLLGKLENEQRTILSDAYRRSEEIKGKADAEAASIYSAAYQQDAEFFEFWRSIESYRKTLPTFKKTLTTDLEYFKYLYSQKGGR